MKKLKKSKNQGNYKNYFIIKTRALSIACFTVFVALTACSKDDDASSVGDCGDFNWAQKAEKQIFAWSNAATAYSEEPTTVNCNKYKTI